jgi:hypothetical protein
MENLVRLQIYAISPSFVATIQLLCVLQMNISMNVRQLLIFRCILWSSIFFLIPLKKERCVFQKTKIKILHQPIHIHFLKYPFMGYE